MTNRIDERIDRTKKKINGTILYGPYKQDIGGEEIWVSDVIIEHDQQVLYKVAIADYNFAVRYAHQGSPVELEVDRSGMFRITGRAKIQKNAVTIKSTKPGDLYAGLEGLTFVSGNTYQTGNGNNVTVSDDTETTYEWRARAYTLGEMTPWGTYWLGYTVIERV